MAYIGKSPQNGVRNRFVYAATQGQTAFTGADADSKTLVVSDQLYTDVYQNGVKLKLTTDWTATTTTVTLVNAASADDVIEIVSFDVFSVSDTVPASTGGTFVGQVTFTADTTFADGADIVTASAGTSNFRAGVNAGNSIISGGNYNTVVGDESGTAITTGDNNVLLGYAAGDAITTSGNHVAIGANALSTVTTVGSLVAVGADALKVNAGGYGNTAIGANALTANTSGNNNTTLGQNAGMAVTSGSGNTFVGQGAGDGTDDGVNNVAVGIGALSANAVGENVAIGNSSLAVCTASNNTAVGASSGKAVTSGSQNVFVGNDAGLAVIGGANHVAVGYRALRASTSANGNTAVGRDAGLLTTGGGNTFLGDTAGDNVTTGVNNILIGNGPTTSQVDSQRQIVMGRDVVGAGGDHLTFGDGSTDSAINFGATSITAPSDVRYKEDIADATAGLAFIKDLRPVTFKWKKEKDLPTSHRAYVEGSESRTINDYTNHGFIAQEVKAVIDAHSEIKDGFDMWSTDEQADGGRQRIGDASLMPIMVKAVQELSKKNDALEARLAALEAE